MGFEVIDNLGNKTVTKETIYIRQVGANMKKEIAEIWVAALRSGKYKQSRKKLRTEKTHLCVDNTEATPGFCCLGVLCDISGLGTWVPRTLDDQSTEPDEYGYQMQRDQGRRAETTVLPTEVRDWAGMDSEQGSLVYTAPRINGAPPPSLASQNDDGATFEELAAFIEANVEYL